MARLAQQGAPTVHPASSVTSAGGLCDRGGLGVETMALPYEADSTPLSACTFGPPVASGQWQLKWEATVLFLRPCAEQA